jgi:uncharacterized protein YabN with tetrapyrrole methylase and pyrophosphatase domain
MSNNLYNELLNASEETKKNIRKVIDGLLKDKQMEKEVEKIDPDDASLQEIFDRLTNNLDIHKVREASKDERNKRELVNHQFNYGEIVNIITFRLSIPCTEYFRKSRN